ncbi:alpha/beta hydrolase [Bacillus sp. DX1.1]|uniref:alpha/beta hydrolase n=1 Tax=unclassified Bacillus (in: firmicutes) TaxID=185979 RepID=UPI0025708536|nr:MULTISPECIES: alpha/beta hydrolase [unclassified Bacillus (in: firmicutes)]MDM5153820.1 alpha/beta hydrolase [Bacillus sp. DX1.1]WJE82756.1 alpha/beta hydrolase [Bacillus sp. DX3.1]
MSITERFFYLEQQPCVIYLPEKPNGFGVMLLGDYNYFIENGTSLWTQHAGRSYFLNELINKGYTVFSSNLYGRHWGNDQAVRLAKRLYHVVMKKEILNEQVHIIADGMGALVALQMMNQHPECVRSVVMFNPCLDLPAHVEFEKEHKFFYKRLVRELLLAYDVKEAELEAKIAKKAFPHLPSCVPVKIYVSTQEKKERKQLLREYEKKRIYAQCETSLSFHLQDVKYKMVQHTCCFFKKYEEDL